MDKFEREIKACFLQEATQAAAAVEQCFLSLERDPHNQENLDLIFRLAHNLKGSSNAVGFTEMTKFTHAMESFIYRIKKGTLAPAPHVVSLLLRLNDFLVAMIQGLKADLNAKFDFQELLTEMANCSTEIETKAGTEIETELVDSNSNTQANDDGSEFLIEQAEQEEVLEFPMAAKKTPVTPSSSAPGANSDESIRVAVGKVEKLINYVGEMVIIQSVLFEEASRLNSSSLRKTVSLLGKVSKEIQDISMSLRMIPVKPTFQKMARIVRDTSRTLEKDVVLELTGEETEMDKTILEKINDPLVHLIRNSIDHGIEDNDSRIKIGKSARGKIELRAYHRSGRLIIEVSDDGRGLNPKKLTQKAIENGLLRPGAEISDQEAYNLIFLPGFSTKEEITDISGRGVGMNVVKENLQDLGGEITIESVLDQGTTFRMSLPLTLAIVEAMIVTCAGQRFVVPLGHVHETVPTRNETVTHSTGIGEVLLLRGESLRLFRLGDFFSLPSPKKRNDMIAIVVRTGTDPFAILVDDIVGKSQVVVKQLSPDLAGFVGVSGTTILGDGKPALILEMADLPKRKIARHPQTFQKEFEGGKSA